MPKALTRIILLIIVLALLGFGGFMFVRQYYTYQITKPGGNTSAVNFTINAGDSVQTIAFNLYKDKIIDDTFIFSIYVRSNNLDTSLEAGKYILPAHANIEKVASLLQNGKSTTITVTIPEGLRIEEIGDRLKTQFASAGISFDEQEFIKEAKTPSLFTGYTFIPTNTTTLEGFLFPDTYQLVKDATPTSVITTMLDTFREKIYDNYLSSNSVNGQSFYNDLILASILEREARTQTDKKTIADILLRRLSNNFPLGVDATIQYELGYSQQEQTWWRQTIYAADLDNNNPYNTRINTGLPPTPISNPGVISFDAVLSPTPNTYYYYISDSQGIIHYAHTLAEQNVNISKYLY